MYLKNPNRYSKRGQRRPMIPVWRLLRWFMIILFALIGVVAYQNREMVAPEVEKLMESIRSDVDTQIDRMNITPPTATPDTSNDRERALAAWNRGSIQEAVDIYERIIAFEPNNLIVHFQLAFGLIMEGQFDEALQAAENTITADPFSPHGWTIRAMALNRLGRYGEAAASAIHALSLIPSDDESGMWDSAEARAMAFQAEAYLNLGLGDRAQTIIERAIETDAESAEAYQVRGQINQLINFDFDAARQDYAEAYTLNPNLVYLGIWLARMDATSYFGNYTAALEIYQNLIERNPGNPQVLFDLGTYYYRVDNDFNRAQESFTRCIESDPDYQPCQYMMGRTQWELEQPSLAIEPLLTAIRLNGEDPYSMWWLARAYRDLGECPDAVPYLQLGRQIAVSQQDTTLVENYDWLYGQCGLALAVTPTPDAEATEEAVDDSA